MKPFDLEIWFGDRVAVLGSNGSGKSHFLRLLAARRQLTRTSSTSRSARPGRPGRPHRDGQARRPGPAGLVRPDARPPRAGRPDAAGDPAPRRRPPRRDGPRAGAAQARPLRARPGRGAALRDAVRRPAGAVPDPAAGAVRRDPAAAGRADRQPRPRTRPRRWSTGWTRSRAPWSR